MRALTGRIAVAALVAAMVVSGIAGAAHAQLVTYDNFDGASLNPDKWFVFSIEGPASAPSAEAIRELEGGKLHLSLTSYGGTTTDTGTVLTRQGVGLKQLGQPWSHGFITGLSSKVTILAARAQACLRNPETSGGSRARVVSSGVYFNDGSSTGPDDRTGDTGSFLLLQRDNDGGNRIYAGIFRCSTETCSTSTTLVSTPFTTTWKPNTPFDLKTLWQKDAGKFRFSINDSEVKDVFYPTGLVVAGPPVTDFKNLRVENVLENCTGGRKQGRMEALFENVLVRRQP